MTKSNPPGERVNDIKHAITNRSDMLVCKRLVDMYVEKVIVNENDIEVVLKIAPNGTKPDADNHGGGGGSRTHVRRGTNRSFSERILSVQFCYFIRR